MLGLALLAGPAAAVAAAPTAYEQAVAHRLAGRHLEAVERFRAVLEAEPDHVDALVGMGLSLLSLDRHAEVEIALRRAVTLAPEYWDAHVGLARVSLAQGDPVTARSRLGPVLAAEPGHADAAALARRLASSDSARPPRMRADLWRGRSELSDGLPPWSQAGAVITAGLSGGWSGSAAVERTVRFDRSDVYFEAGAGRAFARTGSWRVAVGGTPDADHRPELALRSSVSVPVRSGWSFVADGGWARYPLVEVLSFSPGLEVALHDRLTLMGRWVAAAPKDEDLLSGYSVRADWAATDRIRATLSWADAPESSEGRPVEVETLSLGLATPLSDRVSLRLTGAHETRESFTRDELVVSTAVRF